MQFDRRSLLRGGALAGSFALLPAWARAQAQPLAGFTHSVASGEPGPESMLLWTRYVAPGGGPAPLRVEIADDPGLGRVVATGEGLADPANDWCVKTVLAGLAPGRTYYYRFTAPDGTRSEVGRTRTLPRGRTGRFNIAVFSCSNRGFGHFNAYGHAVAQADIDLVVHLGDYIYEYAPGTYPSAAQAVPGRELDPPGELLRLDDYRRRYANYRTDPDLAGLHRRFPAITIWDDHEIANDTWLGGAQNHQAEEGDWWARKAAATKAHREWLPNGDRPYARYEIGDLVTLLALDTRAEGRDRQFDYAAILAGATDRPAVLKAFADGPYRDPARTLLGKAQEYWTADALAASVKAGTRWQLVAQQLVMGAVNTPREAASWLSPDAPAAAVTRVRGGLLAAAAGLPASMDGWGGYPSARTRFLGAAQAAGANLVVISGDSHNAWGCDLRHGGKPAGTEFAGQGVSSPGFESAFAADPRVVAAGLVAASDELKWCDTSQRGYLALRFAPDTLTGEWRFSSDVRTRAATVTGRYAATVRRGSNRLALS